MYRVLALALCALGLVAAPVSPPASAKALDIAKTPQLAISQNTANILALLPDARVTGKSAAFPDLTGWVVDYAGMFTDGEKRSIENTLSVLSEATTHQVVLATISSLNGRNIDDYVKELGRLWQLGYGGAHNGVIILLAAKEHLVAVDVGDDLKQVLTNTVVSAIIDNTITQQSKAGDVVPGIRQAVKYTALALERYARGLPVTSLAPLLQRRAEAALRACPRDALDNYERLPEPKVLVGSEFGCRWSNEPLLTVEQITEEALRLCQGEWGLECTLIKSSPELPVDTSSPPPIVSIVQCANTANPNIAITACTAVLALEEETEQTYADALTNRGLAYYYKGDPQNAVADWDEAIRRAPILIVTFDGDLHHVQAEEAVKSMRAASGASPPVSPDLDFDKRYLSAILDLDHRDYARAIAELKRLSLLGVSEAQAKLGLMYLEGNGIPRDPITANWWLYLAAENGDAPARVALGKNLSAGYGIAKDMRAAAKWFRKAAGQGYGNATPLAEALEAQLDPNGTPPPAIVTVGLPKLITVGSNLNDETLRAIFNGGFENHRQELGKLSAKSIHIPELTIDQQTTDANGLPITIHTTYRDIELLDVVNGVARSASVRGMRSSAGDALDIDLGRIAVDGLDLVALLAAYLPPESSASPAARMIYKHFEAEGGVFNTPFTRCDIHRVVGGSFKMRPMRDGLVGLNALSRAAATSASPEVLLGALRLEAEYIDAISAEPFTWDGLDCSGLDPGGRLYSYRIGKMTVAALDHGRFPPITFEDIRISAPGMTGRIAMDKLVIKSIDLAGPIGLLKSWSDTEPAADWIQTNIRKLVPAFHGIELSGMKAEWQDDKAPARWEITSLAKAALDLAGYVDGLPTTASISVSHLKTNNVAGSLHDLGIDGSLLLPVWDGDMDLSASISAKRNPEQQNAKVAISIDGVDLGTINATADLAGLPQTFFPGGVTVLQNLRLKTARFDVKDAGMVLLALRLAASQAGKDAKVFRTATASWAEGALYLALDASPDVQKLARAVAEFITGGGSLSVQAKAKNQDGITLSAIAPLLGGHTTALGSEFDIQSSKK